MVGRARAVASAEGLHFTRGLLFPLYTSGFSGDGMYGEISRAEGVFACGGQYRNMQAIRTIIKFTGLR